MAAWLLYSKGLILKKLLRGDITILSTETFEWIGNLRHKSLGYISEAKGYLAVKTNDDATDLERLQ